MKTKTKNVELNSSIGNRALLNTFCSLSFSFLSLCFLTSLVDAQISSEQLDPTNSLVPYLTETLFDVNIPTVRQMQPVKSRSTRQERDIRLSSVEALQISNVDAESSTTGVNQKLTHKGFTIPASQSNHLGRQLWRAGISAYEGEKDRKSKVALKRIIEQIRSVEFAEPKKTVEPVIIVGAVREPPVQTVEPNETSSHTEDKEPRTYFESNANAKNRGGLTDRTLQLVDELGQHPDRSDNPFALGEVLYSSGRLKEAAVFYQEALKRKSSDKAGSDQDRAWILFQIGNCLRVDDPPTAKKMYGLLITEYSDSPWVDLAKAREGLIDWQQKDKPRTLIVESRL
ncbi:MAG TPA: hypothetical protein HPP66_05230 [Planctomycetes bacterium]|nr:hypothetical protein [Planctomycetota bacterium]